MRFAAAVAVATLCFSGSAEAGPKPPVPVPVPVAAAAPSPAAKSAAKMHFRLAEQLFQQGAFPGAEVEYQAAYQAWPLDGFLFNIAQCERNQGHVDEAIRYLEQFLASPNPVRNRPEVEKLLAELREQRAGAPAAAATTPATPVASAPAVRSPTPSPAAPPATAASPAVQSPAVVAAVPSTLAPTAAEASAAAAVPAAPVDDETPVYRKNWFWVAAGAAVVVVAGVIAVSASASSETPAGSLGTADWR